MTMWLAMSNGSIQGETSSVGDEPIGQVGLQPKSKDNDSGKKEKDNKKDKDKKKDKSSK